MNELSPLRRSRRPDDAATRPTVRPAPRATTAPRILVIDDDDCARTAMALTLRRCGCDVVEVDSIEEGLRRAALRKPDAIVLDVVSEGLEGWSALRMFKSSPETSSVPVIVVTIQDDAESAIAAGACTCLFKPAGRLEIIAALRGSGIFAHGAVVLAVDPDPAALAMYERLLAPWGYCVARVGSLAAVSKAIDSVRPDVVIDATAASAEPTSQMRAFIADLAARHVALVAIAEYDTVDEIRRATRDVEIVAQASRADAFAVDLADAIHRASRSVRT